ncbi:MULTISPECIES: hypothetical protein [unclassified Pseudoalteromonas]|uniref:hypothetical protein n=1 Tax=unclassified Pseudoalteromonas TaxID=194690 RepID=UPI000B0E9E7D|nr:MULTISPECIES: hypothetical protein [unclassified Pseudoalteromonas]
MPDVKVGKKNQWRQSTILRYRDYAAQKNGAYKQAVTSWGVSATINGSATYCRFSFKY